MKKKDIIKMIDDRIGELAQDNSIKSYIECGWLSERYREVAKRIAELELLKDKLLKFKKNLNVAPMIYKGSQGR